MAQNYNENIEKAKKARAKSNWTRNTDVGTAEYEKKKKQAFTAFSQDQVKKSSQFYRSTGISRNGTDNSGKLVWNTAAQKKYGNNTPIKNSWDTKKPEELNLAETIAMAQSNGAWESYKPVLEQQILDPTSRFYNPYFGGRTTQTTAEKFFRENYGYEGPFDQAFLNDTLWLREHETRSDVTGSITSPGNKGTTEQWAAYWRTQIEMDMKLQDSVDKEWSELRTDLAQWYGDYVTTYGKKPTVDEFIAGVDYSKYDNLAKIDASRNLGGVESSAVLQLNRGTNYSRESLYGLYGVLSNGGDISKDRDYFGDAIQYHARPVDDAPAAKTRLQAMGFSVDGWSDEQWATSLSEARQKGDFEAYETLKAAQWANSPHMEGVDTTDYLGERFGFYKDDAYFENIQSVFAPIWEEMYTDSSKTSIKKPGVNDRLIYRAAYQAWQDYQLKGDTDLVDAQANSIYDAIAAVDPSEYDSYEAYSAGVNSIIDILIDNSPELSKYMSGEMKTARTVFISRDEINDRISDAWNSASSDENNVEVSSMDIPAPSATPDVVSSVAPAVTPDLSVTSTPEETVEPEIVIDKPIDVSPILADIATIKAANDAAKRNDDIENIAAAVIGLSESGTNVNATTLAENNIIVAPTAIIRNEEAANALVALWQANRLDWYKQNIGSDADFSQKLHADPVLKMAVEAAGIKAEPVLTLNGIEELLVSQSESHMNGDSLSIADGIIRASIPNSDELLGAIEDTRKLVGADVSSILDEKFDIIAYNKAHASAVSSGYTPTEAAKIGVNASILSNEANAVAEALSGDTDAQNAVISIAGEIFSSENAADSIAVVSEPINEVLKSAEGDPAIIKGAYSLGLNLLFGMSEAASPTHSAATKDLMQEILSGNIDNQAIKDGLDMFYRIPFQKNEQGLPVPRLEDADEIRLIKSIAKNHEAYAEYSSMWYNSSSLVENEDLILYEIIDEAKQHGHSYNYGTGEIKAATTDTAKWHQSDAIANWVEVATKPWIYDMEKDPEIERYLAYNLMNSYGRWFSRSEQNALYSAWSSGYITYDSLNRIITNRVSEFSRSYVSAVFAVSNGADLKEGSDAARNQLEELQEQLTQNVYSAESVNPTEASARSILQAISSGEDYSSILAENDMLRTYIDYDTLTTIYGEEGAEIDKVVQEGMDKFLAENAAVPVATEDTSQNGFVISTPEQAREINKFLDIYDMFGYYGYEFACAATPEYLNQFGIDFSGVGLNENGSYYLDVLTNREWREPYDNPGIGFGNSLTRGGSKGLMMLGNIPAKANRLIQDALAELGLTEPYSLGQKGQTDNMLRIENMNELDITTNASNFEKFSANIAAEVVRNTFTAYLGAAIGSANAVSAIPNAVQGASVATNVGGTVQVARAANIANAANAVTASWQNMNMISKLPFISSAFTGAYSENKDAGRTFISSFLRAALSSEIEIFTESPLIDEKLSKFAGWLAPSYDNTSDAVLAYLSSHAHNAITEIGQEEISLVFDRVCDFGEEIDTSNISDVRSFFGELWRSTKKSTEGMGQEAMLTAASTFCVTVIGGIGNLPSTSTSRRMFDEYIREGFPTDPSELGGFMEIVIMDMEEAYDGSAEIKENQQESSPIPVFNRTKTDIVKSEVQKYVNGEISEEEFADFLVAGVSGEYDLSVDDNSERENPVEQTEEPPLPVFNRSKEQTDSGTGSRVTDQNDEQSEADTVSEVNPATRFDHADPTAGLSSGAAKVYNYLADSENGVGETVANRAADNVVAETVNNSPVIASAKKKQQKAAAKIEELRAKAQSIASKIEEKNTALRAVFSAAVAEGQDLNSPSVLNSVSGVQQSAAALEGEYAKQQEAVQEAEKEYAAAEEEVAEATETVTNEAETQAKKTHDSVLWSWNNRQAQFQYEEENEHIVQGEELTDAEYREQVNDYDNDDTQYEESVASVFDRLGLSDEQREYVLDAVETNKKPEAIARDRAATEDVTLIEEAISATKSIPGYSRKMGDIRGRSVAPGEIKDTGYNMEHSPLQFAKDDYAALFETGVTNIANAFSDLMKNANRKNNAFMVQISEKDHSKLIGIANRLPAHIREKFKNMFLSKRKQTVSDEEMLPAETCLYWTSDRAKDKYRTYASAHDLGLSSVAEFSAEMYRFLSDALGARPIYQSGDEVILEFSRGLQETSEKAPEIIAATTKFEKAKAKLNELATKQTVFVKAISDVPAERKKEAKEAYDKLSADVDKARAEWSAAWHKLEDALENDEASHRYYAFNYLELNRVLEKFSSSRRFASSFAEKSAMEIRDDYSSGKVTRDELVDALFNLLAGENVDAHNRDIIKKNILEMSDLTILDEIVLALEENEAASCYEDIIKEIPYKSFATKRAVQEYVKENGGSEDFNNLAVKHYYYAHAALLSLWKQYENMLTKSDASYAPLDFKFSSLGSNDFASFINQLLELSSSTDLGHYSKAVNNTLGIYKSPFPGNKGGYYIAVDAGTSGVLRIHSDNKNAPLAYNGDYNVNDAYRFIEDYCDAYDAGKIPENDKVYVVYEENGKRHMKEYGKHYSENGGAYAPSYDWIKNNAIEVYFSRSGLTSSSTLDFSIENKRGGSGDIVASKLDSIDSEFRKECAKENVSNASMEEFETYARRKLSESIQKLRSQIISASKKFNTSGDPNGSEHQKQLSESISSMRNAVSVLSSVLRTDGALEEYLSGYSYRKSTSSGIHNTPSVRSSDSSSSQLDMYRAHQKDIEERTKAHLKERQERLRKAAVENDPQLTENMTPAEQADFYAARAAEAKNRGDEVLTNQYAEKFEEAAKEAGIYTPPVEETNGTTERTTEQVVTTEDDADVEVFANNDPELMEMVVEEMIETESDPTVRDALQELSAEETAESSEENPTEVIDDEFREIAVDEIIKGVGSKATVDVSAFEAAEDLVRRQTDLLNAAQKEVDRSQEKKRVLGKMANAYIKRHEEKAKLIDKRKGLKTSDPEYRRLTDIINGLHTDEMNDIEGRKAYEEYLSAKEEADRNVLRRNSLKDILGKNHDHLYANDALSAHIKGRSFASPYREVYGSRGKSPVSFARSVLNSLKNKRWTYGKLTTFSAADLAEVISEHLDERTLQRNRSAALRMHQHGNELRKEIAQLEYENAYIQFRTGNISDSDLAYARSNLLESYRNLATKKSASIEDYKNYQAKLRSLIAEASLFAKDTVSVYTGKSNDEMTARANEISNEAGGLIAQLKSKLELLDSSEKALFDLSAENILSALNGENGGRLPTPLVDLALGIVLDVSEGKTTKDKAKIRAGIDSFLSKENVTEVQKQIIVSYFAEHLTKDQIKGMTSEQDYDRVMELIKAVEKNKSALLDRFRKPGLLFNKNFQTPRQIIDFLFGDYAPIMSTLYYKPLEKGEKDIKIEHKSIMSEFDSYNLTKEQNAYLHKALDEGLSESQIKTERPDDAEKIIEAGRFVSKVFKEQLERRNEVERRNGLEITKYRLNYTHHIREGSSNRFFKFLGINDLSDDIPFSMLGATDEFNPVRKFDSSTMEREGDETIYDMRMSLSQYLNGSLNTIHQMDNIVRVRQLTEAAAGKNRLDVDKFAGFDRDQNGKFVGYRMSQFFDFLKRLADNAAGKKSAWDRGGERSLSRRIYAYSDAIKSLRAASLLLFNVRSAATNIAPLGRVAAMRPIHTFKAICEMFESIGKNYQEDLNVVDTSERVKTRTSFSAEEMSLFGKAMEKGMLPFEVVDKLATRIGTLALYKYEKEVNGLDEAAAIEQATDIMERLQGSKTKLTRPEIYNSAFGSLALQFTQESLNDITFTIKDMKHYFGGNGVRKALMVLLSGTFYYLLNHLYNDIMNTNSLADPYEAFEQSANDVKAGKNTGTIAKNFAGNLIESINPFDNITEKGASGIPVVSGFIDIGKALSDFDIASGDDWLELGLAVLGFFPGHNQISRTIKANRDISRGYSTKENGRVKYLLHDTPYNRIAGSIFGTDSLADAEEYYESGYSSLLPSGQDAAFQDLVDGGMEAFEAYNAVKYGKQAKDETKAAVDSVKNPDVAVEESVDALSTAQKTRDSAGIPDNLATWAIDSMSNTSSKVYEGVQLWKQFGVETYPKDLGSDEANSEYKTHYNVFFGLYQRGNYGEVGSQEAISRLEKNLADSAASIKKKYETND